jgi:hypothetical protein
MGTVSTPVALDIVGKMEIEPQKAIDRAKKIRVL